MGTDELQREFEYYKENQDHLVAEYNGKVIVLKEGKVIGVFDTELEAVLATEKEHKLGSFFVQQVSPGPEAYTLTVYNHLLGASIA